MKDPAVTFKKAKLPYFKISLAKNSTSRFVEGSYVGADLHSLNDMFSELDGSEEIRITRVYMTREEFNELGEFDGF